jgi:hypothetical protein
MIVSNSAGPTTDMFGTASSSDEPPGEPAGARSDRGIRQPVFSGGDPQATGADRNA